MTKKQVSVPQAYTGEPDLYIEPQYMPAYVDNYAAVLHVCICNGCEDLKPRLEELAKNYKLNLLYFDEKDGLHKQLINLFQND